MPTGAAQSRLAPARLSSARPPGQWRALRAIAPEGLRRALPGGYSKESAPARKTDRLAAAGYYLLAAKSHLVAWLVCQRDGLQAAPGSRARLARHEAGHRPAPRLPQKRRTHPRPCRPLLAGASPGPHRRERPL